MWKTLQEIRMFTPKAEEDAAPLETAKQEMKGEKARLLLRDEEDSWIGGRNEIYA